MRRIICIYGAGNMGLILLKELIDKGYLVSGFMDLNKEGEIEGYPILSAEKISQMDNCCVIISIQNLYSCVEAYKFLKNISSEIYWYWSSLSKVFSVEDCCINISGWGDNVIPRLDMHVSDTCNLNCVGCTHFSPLYKEVGCDYKECMNNLELVLNRFSGIARLNLLGGEPFLNKKLPEILIGVRDKLPSTSIVLFTNGLLICKLPDNILNLLNELKIQLYISEYKPTHNMIENIVNKLDDFGVSYELSGYDNKLVFNKPLAINSDNLEKKCMSNGCISIANGKIARCPTLLYVDILNERFDCKFPTEGIFDLNDNSISGDFLLERLKEEIPLCNYCVKNEIEWTTCEKEKKLSDFVKVK